MILGFKTSVKGKPTGFVDKIISGQKIHTLREDANKRWCRGMEIQFATGVRTKQYDQFLAGDCLGVQEVFMSIEDGRLSVSIDSRFLYRDDIALLAKNDGFDSIEAFEDWFMPIVKAAEKAGKFGIFLRLIHWTSERY